MDGGWQISYEGWSCASLTKQIGWPDICAGFFVRFQIDRDRDSDKNIITQIDASTIVDGAGRQ